MRHQGHKVNTAHTCFENDKNLMQKICYLQRDEYLMSVFCQSSVAVQPDHTTRLCGGPSLAPGLYPFPENQYHYTRV